MLWTFEGLYGTFYDLHFQIFFDTVGAIGVIAIKHYTVATLFPAKANITTKPFVSKQLVTFELFKFCGKKESEIKFQIKNYKNSIVLLPVRILNIFGVDSFSTTRLSNLPFPLHFCGM